MNWWDLNGSWWRSHATLRILCLLLLGQLVSLSLALASFSSSLIAYLGVDAPITQSSFTYLTLALVYGSILLCRCQRLRVSWYWYLLLGFVDVQGNYLAPEDKERDMLRVDIISEFGQIYIVLTIISVNKAYQFSSITSVTLLDCFTIAWVIVLTRVFLSTRYSAWQLLGAVVCVLGLGLVLLSDAGVGGGGGSRPLLGDVLVIAGTVFFALSNVGEEFFVKKKDRVEVVAMLGACGLVVSIIQLSILELKSLESVKWSVNILLAVMGYTFSCSMFYTLTPFVLKFSGATLFNLSLLTSDMWAVVFRIFFYHQEVDWLYYLAFSVVAVGLIIYSTFEKGPAPSVGSQDGDGNVQYQLLIDENRHQLS